MAVSSHAFYQYRTLEVHLFFFLHFPCFDFLKIQWIFFKGKIDVHVFEINGMLMFMFLSFLPGVYLPCGMATTAPQLLPSTAAPQTFLIPSHLLLKLLTSVGPKNENIPPIFFHVTARGRAVHQQQEAAVLVLRKYHKTEIFTYVTDTGALSSSL